MKKAQNSPRKSRQQSESSPNIISPSQSGLE